MSGAATSSALPEFGRAEFIAATGAPPEAMARLDAYAALLVETNAHTNLVSAGSLAHLWLRHMFDSAQLLPLVPRAARSHVDFGSGAGFPGLVMAAIAPQLETTLVESIEKKANFLAAAAAAMSLGDRVRIVRGRAESIPAIKADLITARAVADLGQLLGYAPRFAARGTLCLFPKGRTAADELTAARRSWTIAAELIPSRSDPSGSIIAVRHFAPKGRS